MKAIRAIISTLLILLMLIFLVLPVGIGLWVKHSYQEIINDIPPSSNVSVKLVKYQLGWFHSKATIAVDLHLQGFSSSQQQNNIRFVFYSDIKQGPLIFAKSSNGSKKINFALAQTISRAPNINFQSTSTWHFNNEITNRFLSKNFKITFSGMIVKLKGLQGSVTYDLDSKKWKGTATISSGSVATQTSPPTTPIKIATFNDVKYSGHIHRASLIVYGKQSLRFNNIMLLLSPKKPTISNFYFSSNVTQNKNTTSMQIILNAEKIMDTGFGINTFALDFAFNNLNTEALNHFLKTLRTQDEHPNDKAAIPKIIKSSMKLLQKSLSLNLNLLDLGTAQGKLNMVGSINIPKLDDNAGIVQLAALASANFQLRVPKQWLLEQVTNAVSFLQNKSVASTQPRDLATMMLKRWEDENLLIPQGNNYASAIIYKNGKLLINGKASDFRKLKSSTLPPKEKHPYTPYLPFLTEMRNNRSNHLG